jgi:hypothetical protein
MSIGWCWWLFLFGGSSFLVLNSCFFGLLEFGEKRHGESRECDMSQVVVKSGKAALKRVR